MQYRILVCKENYKLRSGEALFVGNYSVMLAMITSCYIYHSYVETRKYDRDNYDPLVRSAIVSHPGTGYHTFSEKEKEKKEKLISSGLVEMR